MNNPYEPPKDSYPFQHDYGDDQPVALTLGQILFSFEGRIPRKVYWIWTLVTLGLFIGYAICVGFVAAALGSGGVERGTIEALLIPGYLAMGWVDLALQIKRWHDRGKSGWWIFLGLVPCIGGILVFAETGLSRGTYGPNQYGPDPTELY